MTDEEKVSQALAELWDIVRCRCHEAYTGRGLHDPDCECDSTDALQIVTNRIEALTKERDALFRRATLAEEWRDHDKTRAEAAEAKLSKAVGALESALRFIENTESELGVILGCGDKSRATLAEIKGESYD